MSSNTSCDILITGAGPAGSSAALYLASQGIGCTLVDKDSFPRDKICGDALSGKTIQALKKIAPSIVEELNENEQTLGSWGVTFVAPDGESLRVPFTTQAKRSVAPGFIAKRIDFDNLLFQKAKSNPLIQVFENAELRKFHVVDHGIEAVTKSGEVIQAKLIIAADGAYSPFAKQIAGLKTEPEHNCFGLRAYYKNVSGMDEENFIELHFMKDTLPGYFWIFPLPNGEANVGLGIRADKLKEKNMNLKKSFEEILQKNTAISKRFSHAERIGDIRLFGLPLGSKKRNISGERFMLCGDAAQLIDPFTGEGIGNAMVSGIFAAEQAMRCLSSGNYSASQLKKYDEALYSSLWSELRLSYMMQRLVNFPSLFNLVVRQANRNPTLRETISCMFEDLDMRSRLKNPAFYFKLLFSHA